MTKQIDPLQMENYPWNLLIAIKGTTTVEFPRQLTPDVRAGIQYALSSLNDQEREILCLRYQEKKGHAEICACFAISPERARQMETKALKKLRMPNNWNYIRYGVAGYLKMEREYAYNSGYNKGYDVGYRNGAEDVRNGKERFSSDNKMLHLPIENMRISRRTYDCLKRAGYTHDVVGLSAEEIWKMRGMGEVTADEIALILREYGFRNTAWDGYLLQPEAPVL